MNVELKNVKIYKRMSEETTAFNGTLYINGKRAADASNRGHGEPNQLRFTDRELERRFNNYCDSLPAEKSPYGDLPMNADFFVSLLVEKHEQRQLCKNKTVFTVSGKGTYQMNVAFSPEIKQQLQTKYGAALTEILNEKIAV